MGEERLQANGVGQRTQVERYHVWPHT